MTLRTVSFRVQSRLAWLEKREKGVSEKIAKTQKQIDAVPKLQKRLEELKEKLKQIQTQRELELKEIQKLVETFTPKPSDTKEAPAKTSASNDASLTL